MKLAIYTCYREYENFTIEPDSFGEKIYIVENVDKINDIEIVELMLKLESSNDSHFSENITSNKFVDDSYVICEDWESPIMLTLVDNKWEATKSIINEGEMVSYIDSTVESWTLNNVDKENNPTDCVVEYMSTDGEVITSSQLKVLLGYE